MIPVILIYMIIHHFHKNVSRMTLFLSSQFFNYLILFLILLLNISN